VPLTRKEAEELGLEVYRLVTWDFEKGNPRRTQEGEVVTHLLYGLDDLEIGTRLLKRTLEAIPPDVLQHEATGIPLRLLYVNLKDGILKRAVPISWNEGVDYYEWKFLKE
jgi:hypothetical protein